MNRLHVVVDLPVVLRPSARRGSRRRSSAVPDTPCPRAARVLRVRGDGGRPPTARPLGTLRGRRLGLRRSGRSQTVLRSQAGRVLRDASGIEGAIEWGDRRGLARWVRIESQPERRRRDAVDQGLTVRSRRSASQSSSVTASPTWIGLAKRACSSLTRPVSGRCRPTSLSIHSAAWTPCTTGAPNRTRRAATGSMCIGLTSPLSAANLCWSTSVKVRVAVPACVSIATGQASGRFR